MKSLVLLVLLVSAVACSSSNSTDSLPPDPTTDTGPETKTDSTRPPSPRTDIVHVATAEHVEGSGVTATMTVDIPDDAVSFTISAQGTSGVYYHVDSLQAPDGTFLALHNWRDSPLNGNQADICIVCINRIASSETAHAVLVPNTPDIAIQSGTYTFRLFGFTKSGGSAFSPPTVEPASGTVEVTVTIKRTPTNAPVTGLIDLNLYFTGADDMTASTAVTHPRLQEALTEVAQLYSQVGIGLGTIRYADVDESYQIVDGFNGEGNDFEAITSFAAEAEPGINVFFVRELIDSGNILTQFGVILGIAGGIPGPTGVQGTARSAVLIATQKLSDMPGTNITKDTLGATIAHEMGHYLGLFHTSEFGFGQQQLHDPIQDTLENDKSNLMYYESTSYGEVLSDGQGNVMHNNPWVYSSEEGSP